jgi:hypothetical protein
MPFSISEFKSNIASQGGLLKNNRFAVRITPPISVQSSSGFNVSRYVEFFADSANIPGISLQTAEVRRQGVGNIEKLAWGASFTDLELSFFVDQKTGLWSFFKTWMESIYAFDVSNGTLHELNYKENYATTISLFVYNEISQKAPILIIDFQDAFPIAMPDIPLNWGSQELIKLNIRFNYRSWNVRGSTVASPATVVQPTVSSATPPVATRIVPPQFDAMGNVTIPGGVEPIPNNTGLNNNNSNINIQF